MLCKLRHFEKFNHVWLSLGVDFVGFGIPHPTLNFLD